MFLRNNSIENWFVSSERPRKSTLVLFPRRTESSLAEAVYARRKIVCISHIVLRGKTKIALALHRQETTVQQSWDNEHVETELDKKKIIFFSLKGLFLTRPNIPNIFNWTTWLLASEFNLHCRISQYFAVHNQLMRKKEMKEDRKRTRKFHWNWNLFSRIADVTEGTIPKLSGYWHKL